MASTLCADCRRRAETNPLRVLDCKVEADQPVIDKLPSILDHLCAACAAHFDAVAAATSAIAASAFEVRPRLVRGLDYYTRTTFEITHGALGAQNSVLGGGRYDGLAESLGSKVRAPGIGFSIGEDRLLMTLEEAATRPSARRAWTCSSLLWARPRSARCRDAGARVAAPRESPSNWDWTAS